MSGFDIDKYRFVTSGGSKLFDAEIESRRKAEIQLVLEELRTSGIFIKDLINKSPNLRERNKLLNIAMYVLENEDIYKLFLKKKKLPIGIISKKTKVSRDFLEKWNEYLIFYTILVSLEEVQYLLEYIKFDETVTVLGNGLGEDTDKSFKGIVFESGKSVNIIVTATGLVKKIVTNKKSNVGSQAEGNEDFTRRNIKRVVGILVALTVFIGGIIIYQYNDINKVVVVETTSNIKLEVNHFDRIISISSPTEKGQELIGSLSLIDEKLDYSMYKIIEYANKNNLIPDGGIILTVSGEAVKYGALEQTGDYVVKENIDITFNNAGREQSLTIYK